MHETTEDDRFTGRDDPLARLDGWAADPAVRLIAVTAMGGLGKTALVAHWLRTRGPSTTPPPEGQFFWSFYRERDEREFFESLISFGREQLGWSPARSEATLVDQALDLLRSRRLQLALDGLEVIQELPDTVAYGKLLAVDLADFLQRYGRGQGPSTVLLTSRFPFADLTPFLGGALRSLPLGALSQADGARLLESLGISGEDSDRQRVSKELSGHPVALRIFARSMPADLVGDPTRLWELVFSGSDLPQDDALGGKLTRLLEFYQEGLPVDQRDALGLLSIFRARWG